MVALFLLLKGMTGALAPISYQVTNNLYIVPFNFKELTHQLRIMFLSLNKSLVIIEKESV
jgi:hypothetical protein